LFVLEISKKQRKARHFASRNVGYTQKQCQDRQVTFMPGLSHDDTQRTKQRDLTRMALPGIFAEISAAANLAGMAAFVFCDACR
jgi:hypothetical protein